MPRHPARLLFALALATGLLVARGAAQSSAPSNPPNPEIKSASAPVTPERLAQLEQRIADAQASGDNAWMLTSAALVLLMTGPGLALFYAGLVRKKNVLGTMMQSFTMMAVVTVLWAIFGYSLVFHGGSGFLGNLGYAFLHGVGSPPNPDYAATIPQQTFMVYQLMFAIITPALITERSRADEIQRHGALHDLVVRDCIRSHGAHGLGKRRCAQCSAGRSGSDA